MSTLLPATVLQGLLCALLTVLPGSAWAVILQDMKATSLADGMVEIRLTFDGTAPAAHGYSVDQPPRISLDLPYTNSALPKYNEVALNNVKNVIVLEAGDRTRMVINLHEPDRFTTQTDGRSISIFLGSDRLPMAPQPAAMQRHEEQPSQFAVPYAAATTGIAAIDFERGEDGEGNVLIALKDTRVPMDTREFDGRIRLEFQGDILPLDLRNRLDVIDFATPVKFIDAMVEDGNTIILIEPQGKFEYLVYQTDNLLTISVKAEEANDRGRRKSRLAYKGEKMSLNFQDIEVRAVLQLIADFTDLNLVASDTVGGNVTLRLQNVPWDQALDIVLKAKGLDKRLQGNVLTVAPASEIAARAREPLENEKQIRELAPVFTDLIQINYADAAEIANVLRGGDADALLTERGSVQVVERTNSLLVKDTQAKLDELRELIEQLDIPIQQVMIEARIVSLSSKFSENLGINWSGLSGGGEDGNGPDRQGEGLYTDFDLINDEDGNSSLSIGFSNGSGNILNLELSALLSDGGGEVISQPKVITSDKKKAVIKSGQEIPYQEKTSSGATSTAYKDALLALEVTPQITPDGRVMLNLKINNDSPDQKTVEGVVTIASNEITTEVLVEDGETVVIGGVFTQDKQLNETKVPFIGDVPYLGRLFRSNAETDNKSELLVFITPRVIKDGASLR